MTDMRRNDGTSSFSTQTGKDEIPSGGTTFRRTLTDAELFDVSGGIFGGWNRVPNTVSVDTLSSIA